jgi:glutamyl/glutaminyl-tRNA synthetase
MIRPEEYGKAEIAKRISEYLLQSPDLRNEDVYHLLRFMVTGKISGPNITQACAIIGQHKICRRLAIFSEL